MMNEGSTCPKGCGVTLVELAAGASHRQNCPLSSTGRLKAAVEAVLFGGETGPLFSVDVAWLQSLAKRVREASDQRLARLEQDVDATWPLIDVDPAEAKRHDCWLAPSVASYIDAIRRPAPRLGVVPLVAVDNRLVLGKRAKGVNAGKWILPGGGVEFLERLHEAGVREFLEETGVRIEINPDENPITVMQIIGRETHRVCLVIPAKALDPLSALKPSDELSEVRGFTIDELATVARDMTLPVRVCLERLGFLRVPVPADVAFIYDETDQHADDCIACAGQPDDERCPKATRSCGHHCNHTWEDKPCCWCGAAFKPETV